MGPNRSQGLAKLVTSDPIHAATREQGKERLESLYRSKGYKIVKAGAEEPDGSDLTVADVSFRAETKTESLIVALVNKDDRIGRLLHLHDLDQRLGEGRLRVHPLEPPETVPSVRKSLAWFFKQGPVLTVILAGIGAGGSYELARHFPAIADHIISQPATGSQAPDPPERVASVPTAPATPPATASTPAKTTPTAARMPSGSDTPPASVAKGQDEDTALVDQLQTMLRASVTPYTKAEGAPQPHLTLTAPLSYTPGNGTAQCLIHGSITAGSRILVGAGNYAGIANTGDTVDALVSNACQDALHTMVRRMSVQ